MWQHTLNIWRREMMDFLRDRKTLRNSILFPISTAIMFALIAAFSGNLGGQTDDVERLEAEVVATIGKEYLPPEIFVELDELVVQLEPYSSSIEQLEIDVRNGDVALGLIVPDDFVQNIEVGKPVIPIILEASSANMNELGSENRLGLAFERYSAAVLTERLAASGIDPDLLTPVTVETRDVMFDEDASRASRAGSLIAAMYIPFLLAMSIASGGASTAIDTTVGERDRKTLEALLLTPAGESGIFVGKTLKVLTMKLLPTVLSFVTFIVVSQYVAPLIWPDYTPLTILLCIPFMFIVGQLQMMLALRANSSDDAQSTSSIFGTLVLLPMGAGSFMQSDNLLMHLIPGFGTASVIGKMIIAKPFVSYFFVVLISTVVLAAIAIWFGSKMFDRERLLYEG